MSDAEDPGEFESAAAQAGKNVSDPTDMSTEQSTQTDAQTQKIGQVIDGMTEMQARQVDGHEWRVSTWRNGEPRMHEVDLHEVTCTCEDMEYNRDDPEVCDHILLAHHYAKRRLEMEDMAPYHMSNMVDRMTSAVNEIENIRDLQRTMQSVSSEAAAAGTSQGSQTYTEMDTDDAQGGETETEDSPAVNPADARDKLQEAFDEVVPDMQVKATASFVWIQTGMDTPDTLPGPGNVQVFDAFLRNPDQTVFVPDDASTNSMPSGYANAVSQKPGEWWKNTILPEDVDEYISEVLE